jgi:hypothetical protein
VLVTDACIQLGTGRARALIVEAVGCGAARQPMTMAIPYRRQSAPHGFAVYRPRFIGVIGVDEPDDGALAGAFLAGAGSRQQAAAVWNAHLDKIPAGIVLSCLGHSFVKTTSEVTKAPTRAPDLSPPP